MEFSCHTWAFNDLILPEALGTIARLGFRYVDIGTGPHLNPVRTGNPNTRYRVITEIRNDLELFNLKVADLYWMLPRISADDQQKRNLDLQIFKAMLPFAKAVKAPGITVSPGLVHPEDDSEAWERTVSALQEMHKAAQGAGLALSIEPHLDSMATTPERALQLLAAVEGLQITLDWAHFACQGIRSDKILELLPHVRHVHMRQARKNKLQVPFDKGRIDVQEVVQALQEAGYAGFVSVEVMQTVDWHGTQKVNSVLEVSRMRDALRAARDQPSEPQTAS